MTPALLLGSAYQWEDHNNALLPDLYYGTNCVAVTTSMSVYLRDKDRRFVWPKDLDLKDRKAVKLYIESLILTGA